MEGDETHDDDVEASLRSARAVPELMRAAAHGAAIAVQAGGCAISRVVGDVLVELAEFSGTRQTLYLGHGYLISDYPLTREVVEQRETRVLFRADEDADEREVAILLELGFDALLMVPICVGHQVWGLAELYRDGDLRFGDRDVALARRLFDLVGERVGELESGR